MASSGGNCVAYAREVTGIHLDGNASSWWLHAQGHYERGNQPSVGAVLVFKPYGGMHVGHVAVVSRIVGPREILVDQANWVRGRVTKSMSVVDASPLNDWTSVKVQYAGTHGRENPAYGFIYPRVAPASFGETIVEAQPDQKHPSHVAQIADRAKHHKDATERDEAKQAEPAKPTHRLAANKAAQDPSLDETIVEPDQKRPNHAAQLADRAKHHKDATEHAEAKQAEPATPAPRLAANEPAQRKRKTPDAKVAVMY
jgi:surface antigen